MDERSDAALVSAVLSGQREAFAALVRRYQDYAYGIAIGILSDFDLARDVVQEAFLCAYRDLSKLKDRSRFAGWLRGIVRHTAHRALRELESIRSLAEKLGRRRELFAPPAHQSAEEAERRETVRQALGRLNEKNCEAVSLYYVDGLSCADIAEFLGVTKATVQGRLQRARAKLRKELAMVEGTFKEKQLPEDFSEEVKRLLDAAAKRGWEHQLAVNRLVDIGAPAVDPLCRALADPRIPVRKAAARALCTIGDARALGPILRVLYSEDYSTQLALLRTGRILRIPGVRKALLDLARSGRPDEQWMAVEALSHAKGDEEVFDRINEIFRNADAGRSGLRRVALEALCRLAPESAVEFLTEALQGPDLRLRTWACWIAYRDGFLPPIPACLKAFGGGIGWWGRVCAGNLVLKHSKEGRETLERLVRDGSAAERSTAAVALARTGSVEAFNVLTRELLGNQQDKKWLKAVSRTLARQYGRKLAEWVEADRRRLANAPAVMWTLARIGHPEAGGTIEESFREGTPAVRAAALRILTRQKGLQFLPDLRRCLHQGRPRKVAQEAFWQMLRFREAAMPTVEEMLNSEHWTERKAAVCLLRRWGKLTPEQKRHAQNDPHVAVRHAAR